MEQEKSFSKFGKTFQEDLCHLILNDRSFADQMFEVLDLNFLELKHLRVFTGKIRDYRVFSQEVLLKYFFGTFTP